MKKLFLVICSLSLILSSCNMADTGASTPSYADSIPDFAVASDLVTSSELNKLAEHPETDDLWTTQSIHFDIDQQRLPKYMGCIGDDQLIFMMNDMDVYSKITIAVLDISSPDPVITAVRQFYEENVFHYISIREDEILVQYGPVTEIMNAQLETLRTITLPIEEDVPPYKYNLNGDETMAVYSSGAVLDFENNTIVVQSLDDTAQRIEYSAFMKHGDYYTTLSNPVFVANGTKLMAEQIGFEFTASYYLMNLDGSNKQQFQHGGSYFDISDRLIGNDFFIQDASYSGNFTYRTINLTKIDTLSDTGNETLVYSSANSEDMISCYNSKQIVLREKNQDPDDRFRRYKIYDMDTQQEEPFTEIMQEALSTYHIIGIMENGTLIACSADDEFAVTIFIKPDEV